MNKSVEVVATSRGGVARDEQDEHEQKTRHKQEPCTSKKVSQNFGLHCRWQIVGQNSSQLGPRTAYEAHGRMGCAGDTQHQAMMNRETHTSYTKIADMRPFLKSISCVFIVLEKGILLPLSLTPSPHSVFSFFFSLANSL